MPLIARMPSPTRAVGPARPSRRMAGSRAPRGTAGMAPADRVVAGGLHRGAAVNADHGPDGRPTVDRGRRIAVDPRDGSYWLCDEYRPSILHVAPDGTILNRFIPEGVTLEAPGQGVRPILPQVVVRRKANRGFEGVAITPDGARLFAVVQNPLSDPDRATGERSRQTRLRELDLAPAEPRVVGMYVYLLEAAADVAAQNQDEPRIGDIAAIDATRLVLGERDARDGGPLKRLYVVDLAGATNILDRAHFGGRTLERLDGGDLAGAGVTPTRKALLADLVTLGWRREKLEGVALVDERTVAVVNDNDFGFGEFDASGRATRNEIRPELWLLQLPQPLR